MNLTGGLGVAALLLLVALGWTMGELRDTQRELGAASTAVDTCADTNTGLGQSIERLEASNAEWAAKYERDLAASRAGADEVAEAERQRADRLARERDELRRLYAEDPDCDRWHRQLVCPLVDHRLREPRAEGGGTDP